MQESAQIIRLQFEAERQVRARCARLPAVVQAVQDEGRRQLSERLRGCFESADDTLFRLADRATNNAEQNAFFDAMRELRVQRAPMEARFLMALDEAFANLADAVGTRKERVQVAVEALALVADADLEQTVALEAAAKRATREFAAPLTALARGLGTAVPEPITPANNPFGPDVLASSFMEQVRQLDVDIKAKLLIFKQFDCAVLAGLGEVLKALIEVLAQHGIRVPVAPPSGQSQAVPARRSDAGAASESPPVDADSGERRRSVEHSVLGGAPLSGDAAYRVAVSGAAGVVTGAGAPRSGFSVGGAVGWLPSAEGMAPARSTGFFTDESEGWLSSSAGPGSPDEGAVDLNPAVLVRGLFDCLGADADLAAPVRTRLGRLRAPVTKLALTDEGFLRDGNHGARRLLNAIAATGVGLADGGPADAALENCLDDLVERVARGFDGTARVFDEVLADLERFLAQERRRAAMVERRTLAAEDGRARAEQARARVAREIDQLVSGNKLPRAAWVLIDGPWRSVLFVTGLRGGFKSVEWAGHLQTLQELILTVQPFAATGDRQRMIQLIPDVMRKLRAGIELVTQNPIDLAERLAELERVHLARISGEPLPEDSAPVPAPVSAPTPPPKAEIPDTVASVSSATLRQVDALAPGAWAEFKTSDGAPRRCRLAAFIKPTGKYIFVSRTGVKVAERGREELAEELESGAVRLLSDAMLFDRALERIVCGLRPKNAGGPQQDIWRD